MDSNNSISTAKRNFTYPHQVVTASGLSLEEKRAILAAWASDRFAVESLPTLRHLPGTPLPVTLSSVMDARRQLDRLSGSDDDPPPPPAAILRFRRPGYLREAA